MKFPTTKLFIVLALFTLVKNDDFNSDIPEYPKLRAKYGNHTINRPIFHFTPEFGWMNDPNGCWYDLETETYHIYYQYNPNDTVWGMPLYWGHASSKNMTKWDHHNIAIRAPDWAGAYSGSMFIDDECFFGYFNSTSCPEEGKKKYQNTIAAWTWNDAKWKEFQCFSYSNDAGMVFETPKTSDCIDESSTQFRDPQVVKYDKGKYILSVAKSHEYSIHFYHFTNEDKRWVANGEFKLYGYLGFQYECPNLVHLNNTDKIGDNYPDEEESYWVLFISINPGSQQGGSSTEYFFGQYNYSEKVTPYTVNFHYNTLLDQGKDFYATQIMYVPPTDEELSGGFNSSIGITWASNWQYTKVVPTDPWRSSMAIPRRIKLGHYNPTNQTALLYVLSKALLDEDDMDNPNPDIDTRFETPLPTEYTKLNESGANYTIPGVALGALELYIEFISCDAYTDHAPGVITFFLRGGSIPEEYLRIGYNQKADAFFLDRGITRVQWVRDNPFFTDKLTMTVYGNSTAEGLETQDGILKSTYTPPGFDGYSTDYDGKCEEALFKAHIIVDRNIVEIFFNEDEEGYSAITSTNTFFFSGGNFITDVIVDYNSAGKNNDKGFREIKIKGRHLNIKDPY